MRPGTYVAAGLAAAVLLGLAPCPAVAVTFNEATDAPGGNFSDDFEAPTEIGAGFDMISFTRTGTEDFDFFVFTDLPAGAQEIDFFFAPLTPVDGDNQFNAGGALRVSLVPFMFSSFAGDVVGGQVVLTINQTEETRSFTTPDDFDGQLFFSFNFTNGTNIGIDVSAPSNASTEVIPLPASLVLLVSGLAGLGLLRRSARPSIA